MICVLTMGYDSSEMTRRMRRPRPFSDGGNNRLNKPPTARSVCSTQRTTIHAQLCPKTCLQTASMFLKTSWNLTIKGTKSTRNRLAAQIRDTCFIESFSSCKTL